MVKTVLASTGLVAASLVLATPASATVLFSFLPGAPSPSAGYAVINAFMDGTGITGSNFKIKTPPSDSEGAPPANSIPGGTSYLSVLGGGTASIAFGPVSAFQFDWGSIDSYNTLTIDLLDGTTRTVIPGGNFPNLANGDQAAPGTNGLFTVYGDAGEQFTGITLASGTNSFEIDNLAVPVPEPATWGMMILGFGVVGAALRRRNATRTTVRYA